MRRIRRVGAAAAGVLAMAVLGTGCGGSAGDGAAGAPTVVSETPAETPDVEVTDTELPFSTEDPYETVAPEPTGPEDEIDAKAQAEGWAMEGYDLASGFVKDVCESLPTVSIRADSRPQFLVDSDYLEGDGKEILQVGIPKVCPKYTDALKQAVSGEYDRWYSQGTYVVSSKPIEGEMTIPPGTYRAKGQMENCYWERTRKDGEIIDNNFATSAREITITIRSSDGQFTSEGCEVWKPVK